jgi:hypothetical protein
MAEPGMAGEVIGVLTAADAIYFVLGIDVLAAAALQPPSLVIVTA